MATKRLRVFAGPNGSGKSTLVKFITSNFHIPFGYFVNADNIEKELKETGAFDFTPCGIEVNEIAFRIFATNSTFNEKAKETLWKTPPVFSNNKLIIAPENLNSYQAALIADFIRETFLETGVSFTFESVLSDVRKLAFLQKSKQSGYRVYLYYVATENPEINIARVKNRVLHGGHDVPNDKIISRYERSTQLLSQIIKQTNRAYLFDNSKTLRFFAEVDVNRNIETVRRPLPSWVGSLFNSH